LNPATLLIWGTCFSRETNLFRPVTSVLVGRQPETYGYASARSFLFSCRFEALRNSPSDEALFCASQAKRPAPPSPLISVLPVWDRFHPFSDAAGQIHLLPGRLPTQVSPFSDRTEKFTPVPLSGTASPRRPGPPSRQRQSTCQRAPSSADFSPGQRQPSPLPPFFRS